MKAAPALLALNLLAATPAGAAEIDYSKLAFPRDARELIVDPDAYNDTLEYHEDRVQAAVKRLYAATFLAKIIERCGGEGFWSSLRRLPTAASAYLNELRADRDLDSALPHSMHVRETLRHGARSLGRSDAEGLVAQGVCDKFRP